MAWNIFAAILNCSFYRKLHTSAARYFHPYYGDAFDVVRLNDSGQLFAVIHVIKLGTADQGNVISDEFIVKISVGESRAICRNE